MKFSRLGKTKRFLQLYLPTLLCGVVTKRISTFVAQVNKQNCRYWAAKNSGTIHQRPSYPKIIIRCILSTVSIVGPYFYLNRMASQLSWLQSILRDVGKLCTPENWKIRKYWDFLVSRECGHSSYGSSFSWCFAKNVFWSSDFFKRKLNMASSIPWLTPCDYFLHLKAEVFSYRPKKLKLL